ncbi:DUF2889 domain-containing protein [Novosphingobium sp. KCTC 2891]|uniref:DUF2889 domain-containing protein n=1 Tax=Novosphingobium sp. KCTC 2891 TaxID=2989730 RepID=UPI0022217458|nr:DUF2889 domain-containing protein [Novosphingobium sp. KCTC 2891]MCW1383622.1 DUF2889 domain-containing protein [Novosphingobium sp. KCTC 2891]
MARDLYTRASEDDCTSATNNAIVLGDDWLRLILSPDRRIGRMQAGRHAELLERTEGLRPGGELRRFVEENLPNEMAAETLLYRLLDDLAGSAFLAISAWHTWIPGGGEAYDAMTGQPVASARHVEGICIGFAAGAESVLPDGSMNNDIITQTPGRLPFPVDDPDAWHAFPRDGGPNHWRLRRTDVWREDGMVHVDAWFQDSAAMPDRADERLIFHEYTVSAAIDPEGMVLRDISVKPMVLPYRTCLAAPDTAGKLVGLRITDLRTLIPQILRGPAGCTHLNDMLRTFQDVAALDDLAAIAGRS